MKTLFIKFTEFYTDQQTRKAAFSYLDAEIKRVGLLRPENRAMVQILMNHCYNYEKKFTFAFSKSKLTTKMIEAL